MVEAWEGGAPIIPQSGGDRPIVPGCGVFGIKNLGLSPVRLLFWEPYSQSAILGE